MNTAFSVKRMRKGLVILALVLAELGLAGGQVRAAESTPAKELFGSVQLPSRMNPAAVGSYAKGCLAGAVAIPTDGPAWQAMRLSRNRRWGHPLMISLLERFSQDAQALGWPGLLLGDISQPRGGPMLSGHASHQVGLDADIWFMPMPDRRLSREERDQLPFTSMLNKRKFLTVDDRRWTPTHARLVMKAASYDEVERVFVNPAIKKKLCETWQGDRGLLGKVRPVYGHDEHFHIRMKCPPGSVDCKDQAKVPPGDGCDKSLAWWFTKEPWAKPDPKPEDKNKPARKPRLATLSDLPKVCRAVLQGPSATGEAGMAANTAASAVAPSPSATVEQIIAATGDFPEGNIPLPTPRPLQ